MGSAFLRPTFLWLSHGTQRMLQPQFPPAPPEELSRASQGDEEASLVQWVAGMLIRARGCSRRLLSPLTSPTFKLQSGEGAEKMKLETSPASAGIGRGGSASAAPPFPQPHPVSIPTWPQLCAELKDIPFQRVAPHSFPSRKIKFGR